jgi:hypothetical protein
MTVAHVFARWCGSLLNIPVEEMAFLWQLEMAQFHGFRTIAYPLGGSNELYEDYCTAETKHRPGLKLSRSWHDKLVKLDEDGVKYGDMKFSSYVRVRKRWHMEVYGSEYAKQFTGGTINPHFGKTSALIPVTPVDTLDFSPIGHPGP